MDGDEKQTSAGMVTLDELKKLRSEEVQHRRRYIILIAVIFIPFVVPPFVFSFFEGHEWIRPIQDIYLEYYKWFMAIYILGLVALVPMISVRPRGYRVI